MVAALGHETADAGQVVLASGLTVAGWVLFVLSLLAGAAAVFLGKQSAATAKPGQPQQP
ncbi:MAG: hypothetical protein NVS2B15_06050 [Pseudarthrobacter sp.]